MITTEYIQNISRIRYSLKIHQLFTHPPLSERERRRERGGEREREGGGREGEREGEREKVRERETQRETDRDRASSKIFTIIERVFYIIITFVTVLYNGIVQFHKYDTTEYHMSTDIMHKVFTKNPTPYPPPPSLSPSVTSPPPSVPVSLCSLMCVHT